MVFSGNVLYSNSAGFCKNIYNLNRNERADFRAFNIGCISAFFPECTDMLVEITEKVYKKGVFVFTLFL